MGALMIDQLGGEVLDDRGLLGCEKQTIVCRYRADAALLQDARVLQYKEHDHAEDDCYQNGVPP